jgi:hypothetical protein
MKLAHSTMSGLTGLVWISALLTQLASGCTIVVIDGIVARSSVEVRLTKGGNPLADASIDIYLGKPNKTTNDLAYLSLTTNSDGSAVIRDLSIAPYYLIVRSPDGTSLSFPLDVPSKPESRARDRGIELFVTTLETTTAASVGVAQPPPMAKPLQASLQQFRGTIADVTGAVIPNADIKVYADGKTTSEPLLNLRSNNRGEFASDLPQSKYVAIFAKAGSMVQPVAFSIEPGGWKAMWLTVAIGGGGGDCGYAMASPRSKITGY